jgi:hypothetical protein
LAQHQEKGQLERLKHMYCYLQRFKSLANRVRLDQPDISPFLIQEFYWASSDYVDDEIDISKVIPEALGTLVLTVQYMDANLYHDLITGSSVTGILSFCNQTLFDWFSKRQACVQTAKFGSEFVAARIAFDQIIDLSATNQYLSVPIQEKRFMFG